MIVDVATSDDAKELAEALKDALEDKGFITITVCKQGYKVFPVIGGGNPTDLVLELGGPISRNIYKKS